jgi:four helix bundle protein
VREEQPDLRQRTTNFAVPVVRMFVSLPKTTEAQVLGRQMLRSGTSIGANYREAHRARNKSEFVAKCGDSFREAEETAYWLELLVSANLISKSGSPPCGKKPTNSSPSSSQS